MDFRNFGILWSHDTSWIQSTSQAINQKLMRFKSVFRREIWGLHVASDEDSSLLGYRPLYCREVKWKPSPSARQSERPHACYLVKWFLNTVWNSCLEIADNALLMTRSLHNSHTASLIIALMFTLNHLIHRFQCNLLCVTDVWSIV